MTSKRVVIPDLRAAHVRMQISVLALPIRRRSLAIDRQRFGSSLGGLIQLLAIHSAHRVGDVRVAADVPPHRRNDEKSPDREHGDQDSILA